MKLLLDQNLSFKLCGRLADLFPGTTQARLLGLSEATDGELWARAQTEGYAILTHDADFAEMAALKGSPPKIIWLRCGNQPTDTIERLLRARYDVIEAFGRDPDAACLELY
jgi:predicted nuclease of predicted toxin-antitoxin system